jgi:ribosomal subunit interface protein
MSEKTLSVEITGVNLKVDDKTRKYVAKKCAKLIDYIPRRAREAAFADVKLSLVNQKDNNKYECEIVLTLPDKTLIAKDTALNALAAVDIVETKLRGQIRRYKTEREAGVKRGGIMARAKNVLTRRKD